jgi:hypothetical protein
MYIIGFVSLLVGLLLCPSIVWAPIGFFAMGFGLISLLVVEKRNKASKPRLERPSIRHSSNPNPFAPAANDKTRREGAVREEKWMLLVENDPDLAKVERVLSQYGPQYADQLAKAYVVFDNKAFLPIILKMIIASARLNAEGNRTGIGYVFVNSESNEHLDEFGASGLQPSCPESPQHRQTEIGPHGDEKRPERGTDEAPPPPETETFDRPEPASKPSADADPTDDLIRLFDRLVSSRR